MKKPVYNDIIDFQRALLIVMVILVHIVNFGTLYPEVKARIFSFFMPAFLIITGYFFRAAGKSLFLMCGTSLAAVASTY